MASGSSQAARAGYRLLGCRDRQGAPHAPAPAQEEILSVAYSPDGKTLGRRIGQSHHRLRRRPALRRGHHGSRTRASGDRDDRLVARLSPDGKMLAISDKARKVHLRNPSTGQKTCRHGSTSRFTSVSLPSSPMEKRSRWQAASGTPRPREAPSSGTWPTTVPGPCSRSHRPDHGNVALVGQPSPRDGLDRHHGAALGYVPSAGGAMPATARIRTRGTGRDRRRVLDTG